jgi:hypothetical protein
MVVQIGQRDMTLNAAHGLTDREIDVLTKQISR